MAFAEEHNKPVEDSDMKCMRIARELFNAMKAHYGAGCEMLRNEDSGILIFLPPPPPIRIVEFAGPGWYELEVRGSGLPTEELFIEVDRKVPPHPKEGRWFVATSKDPMQRKRYFQESWLRQIIVRKIGGAA
ncbi:MAG: hypothetical protein KL863_07555 [Rhizobium sp.]|nr:hypothetical protein [Rhizobium sp.]